MPNGPSRRPMRTVWHRNARRSAMPNGAFPYPPASQRVRHKRRTARQAMKNGNTITLKRHNPSRGNQHEEAIHWEEKNLPHFTHRVADPDTDGGGSQTRRNVGVYGGVYVGVYGGVYGGVYVSGNVEAKRGWLHRGKNLPHSTPRVADPDTDGGGSQTRRNVGVYVGENVDEKTWVVTWEQNVVYAWKQRKLPRSGGFATRLPHVAGLQPAPSL